MKEGVYFDMPEEEYHADPAPIPSLSAGIAKTLLFKSPKKAWCDHPRLNPDFEPENKERFDVGKAAHSLILRDPRDFVIVEADDWRKKEAKEQRDNAYAEGKTPLLREQWERVQAMEHAARQQIAVHKECSNAFQRGKKEVTLIWQEGEIWCRCRIDHCATNGTDFYDYKSTDASANPDAVQRLAFSMGWDVIEAFYLRGIRKVLAVENPTYRFVVQETEAPHLLSVIAMNPEASITAESKVESAIKLWGHCTKNNSWPGYPDRIAYIGAPAYMQHAWLEREAKEEMEAA